MTRPVAERPVAPRPAADETSALMRRAALAALVVAAALCALKLAAWWWTGSVALLASAADSGLDFLASGVNALAIRHALAPPDAEHRFGHGKTEAVAGMGQAMLIAGSAAFLCVESIGRLIAPEPLANEGWGVGVMLVSIAATAGLTVYQRHVIRRTRSLAVAADRLHYLSDLVGNAAALLALLLAGWFGLIHADGAFGLVIAALIAWSAWTILRQSFDQLIDRELPDDERAAIERAARATPGVLAVHDLRTRAAGTLRFAQMNVELDGALTLAAAHAIALAVERAVREAAPGVEVLIHKDPAGLPPH